MAQDEKLNIKNLEWLINIKYNDIKKMFDPIVDKIIRLVKMQLDSSRTRCSAIFLIGDFSESVYLQKRIKQEFRDRVEIISVPNPTSAISRGAVLYAVSSNVISTRVLKYTYGIEVRNKWVSFFDI